MKLSLIIPCYNEEENIRPMYRAVKEAFAKEEFSYEIIFINDGSRDGTWKELKGLYREKPEEALTAVNFSRNFGKEAAMLAGLRRAKGDFVTIIDADLQQNPKLVLDMLKILEENDEYDCVAAYQEQRREGKLVCLLKKGFYHLINKTSETPFHMGASDFRTFRREMTDAILDMPEYFRFSKGIFSWVGFETYYMPYEAQDRYAGKSNWSFWGLVKYALEGFISFTTFPLKLATFAGAFTSALAILYLIIVVIQKLVFSINIPGYPTIIVLILFLGGMQLLILGIIGEYLGRVYIQGKNRPVYIEKNVLEGKEK